MSDAAAMEPGKRVLGYWQTNGSRRLTPKQRRRIQHKQNHAIAPFGKKAE